MTHYAIYGTEVPPDRSHSKPIRYGRWRRGDRNRERLLDRALNMIATEAEQRRVPFIAWVEDETGRRWFVQPELVEMLTGVRVHVGKLAAVNA